MRVDVPTIHKQGLHAKAHCAKERSQARVMEVNVVPHNVVIQVLHFAVGHTQSWGKGHPEILADCYDSRGRKTGRKGPLDPTKHATYALLRKLIEELVDVFPDQYLHLGGDEVSFDCWEVRTKPFNVSPDPCRNHITESTPPPPDTGRPAP